MTTAPRSIPSLPPRPSPHARPRTLYLDPHDLVDLTPNPASPGPPVARPAPVLLTPERRAGLVAQLRADVRDAADAVLAWLEHALSDCRSDDGPDPHVLLDAILRPGPDPAAVRRPALARAVADFTGVELSPKRLATALRHLRRSDWGPPATSLHAAPPAPSPPPTDPRSLALGLLAAVRQAVGRRTDRDYADALPDEPVRPERLEADALNYLRAALGASPNPGPRGRHEAAPRPLHGLLLSLAPLTGPHAPAPTPTSDLRLVLHAAPAIAALLGPDSLPATLSHLNALVLLREHVADAVYLAEMLRLTHHAAGLKADPDTASLHRFAKRHRLPNPPGATRVASYAAVNAATRLLGRLFDGDLRPDTPIDAPPTWRGLEVSAFPLATVLLERLETTDAGFALTPTTRLLFHAVAVRLSQTTPALKREAPQRLDAALTHFRKLGPTKTVQRLQTLADHDNHDAMVAATAALARRALPQLDLAAAAG